MAEEPELTAVAVTRKPSTGILVMVVAGGNILSSVLRLAGGILTAKILMPDQLGAFNGVYLAVTYALVLQLGVINGLNRELPLFFGKGDMPTAHRLASCALAWAAMIGLITGGISLCIVVWHASLGNWQLAGGWAAVTVSLMCTYLNFYFQSTMRTSTEFVRLSLIQFAGGLLFFTLILLVWKYQYAGLCFRAAIGAAFELFLLWLWRPLKILPKLRKAEFLHLLKIGMPIFAVGYLFSAWRSMDSLFVYLFLGKEPLGLYQLSVIVMTGGASVILALSQVIYPKMAHEFGRSGDISKVYRIGLRPTLKMTILAIPVIAVAWYVLPMLVQWLLPNYTRGIPAAQWTLLTVLASCLGAINPFFNVVRKNMVYGFLMVVGMIVFVLTLWWRRTAGEEHLVGVAQAMMAGVVIFVIFANIVAYSLSRNRSSQLT